MMLRAIIRRTVQEDSNSGYKQTELISHEFEDMRLERLLFTEVRGNQHSSDCRELVGIELLKESEDGMED